MVSTNTWDQMPDLAGPTTPFPLMKLNPAGNILAVAVGTGIQFFLFNGAAPITHFTGIIGKSGYISTLSWDNANHLYALNAKSGKLHVYTVTSKPPAPPTFPPTPAPPEDARSRPSSSAASPPTLNSGRRASLRT